MNTIDVRTEMRKLADSKPVHAAAGVGLLASETLRELPTRVAKWRHEASVSSLSTRATEYVTTARARAAGEYDRLAKLGKRAFAGGETATQGKAELNGKTSPPKAAHPKASHR
ncbi:MAG TPA: hypothetical protein DHU96_17710 [Actinobacteria bacterium]|nr:hypothetical protein [Actinomycetota bacterium]